MSARQPCSPPRGSAWATDPPPPPWFSTAKEPRPRRAPLTRDEIVDAVIALIDRGGLEALTMRAVAAELGTSAASLYGHVSNKQQLLQLVLDRLFGELEVPAAERERWPEQIKQVARDMRRLISRHEDLAHLMHGQLAGGPNSISVLERMLAVLRSGGLPDEVCLSARYVLGLFVSASALEGRHCSGADAAASESDRAQLMQYLESLPEDRFPNIVALAHLNRNTGADQRFEMGLEIIVRGIQSFAPNASR